MGCQFKIEQPENCEIPSIGHGSDSVRSVPAIRGLARPHQSIAVRLERTVIEEYSVNVLGGLLAIDRLAKSFGSWKLHVHYLVPYCIQHQLGNGMKPQLDHDIAAMSFCGFRRYSQ